GLSIPSTTCPPEYSPRSTEPSSRCTRPKAYWCWQVALCSMRRPYRNRLHGSTRWVPMPESSSPQSTFSKGTSSHSSRPTQVPLDHPRFVRRRGLPCGHSFELRGRMVDLAESTRPSSTVIDARLGPAQRLVLEGIVMSSAPRQNTLRLRSRSLRRRGTRAHPG